MESHRNDGLGRCVTRLSHVYYVEERPTKLSDAASWHGVLGAPQYCASKHGVLGLMRALDPIAAQDNIRFAAIHPWFAGRRLTAFDFTDAH
jgi:NAD(P)-dependent dehydrogenase (short-subunit alcohol dehydrogenase family)